MLTTYADFVSAIVRAPMDITLRRVFADFLDEDGPDRDPERARLIRTDAELTRLRCLNWREEFRDPGELGGAISRCRSEHNYLLVYANRWTDKMPAVRTFLGHNYTRANMTAPRTRTRAGIYLNDWDLGFPTRITINWKDIAGSILVGIVTECPLVSTNVLHATPAAQWDPDYPDHVYTRWYTGRNPPTATDVPESVFGFLSGTRLVCRDGQGVGYASVADAVADLGRAVVLAARRKAGLPDVDLEDVPF